MEITAAEMRYSCTSAVSTLTEGFYRTSAVAPTDLVYRQLVFFSSSPTSLAYSKAAAYSNNSFQVKKMASQPTQASGTLDHGRNCTTVTNHTKKIDRYRSLPHSNELSRFLLEAIALCDNVEKTRILSTQTLYDACHILHTFIQSHINSYFHSYCPSTVGNVTWTMTAVMVQMKRIAFIQHANQMNTCAKDIRTRR